jgi:hypothetical protein
VKRLHMACGWQGKRINECVAVYVLRGLRVFMEMCAAVGWTGWRCVLLWGGLGSWGRVAGVAAPVLAEVWVSTAWPPLAWHEQLLYWQVCPHQQKSNTAIVTPGGHSLR